MRTKKRRRKKRGKRRRKRRGTVKDERYSFVLLFQLWIQLVRSLSDLSSDPQHPHKMWVRWRELHAWTGKVGTRGSLELTK